MQINPYLNFVGNCAQAFQFYAEHLGGQIALTIPFADSPMASEVPPDWSDKLVHIRMQVGNVMLMGGDELPEDYIAPQGFNVTLNVGQAAGDLLGGALRVGDGSVRHPMDDQL